MKIAICDDVEPIRDYLKGLLDETKESHEITLFADGKSLLETDVMRYDAIFLDIEMAGINGVKVAEQIRHEQEKACRDIWGGMPLIIFVTGYKEYMGRAFSVHAFDYLLKPVSDEKFQTCYSRAKKFIDGSCDKKPVKRSHRRRRIRHLYPDRRGGKRENAAKQNEIDFDIFHSCPPQALVQKYI